MLIFSRSFAYRGFSGRSSSALSSSSGAAPEALPAASVTPRSR
eukprot:CAMPEP_0115505642 /NCGR_PEP_ID=MMETSP0271-20121206/70694_1 /TAXON_ID=71861 /ORGANISM="Scrippsiella trochoidea, Strain CCMP3099" /LENGTH=42 /DNA_ID= /DNA_START= /DNA_END= /DNA_ORIENTATION=